jgi:hypothetical protein
LSSIDVWQCRDEHNNFEQKFDAELVKEAKRLVAPLFKVHVTLSLTFGLKLTHHQAAMRHDTSHLMGNL